MPNTVNAGWLKDKNGDKFAPKTLTSQVQTNDGTLIEDKIKADIDAVRAAVNPESASIGQTLIVKAVDENGKPTAWESADYQERTHWNEIVEGDILPITEFTSVYNESMGINMALLPLCELEVGKTYTVIFDDVTYTCVAKTGEMNGMAYVGVGNDMFFGGEQTSEPFGVAYVESNSITGVIPLVEGTHTVRIIGEIPVPHKIPREYLYSKTIDFEWGVEDSTGWTAYFKSNLDITIQDIVKEIKSGVMYYARITAPAAITGLDYDLPLVMPSIAYNEAMPYGTNTGYSVSFECTAVNKQFSLDLMHIPVEQSIVETGWVSFKTLVNTDTTVVNPESASVGQTIVVDEVDAYGKPTKWKAVDYQERTHGSEWIELLPETTLTFTNSQYQGVHDVLIEPGKTYKVLWNGTEYILTASYFNLGTMAGNGLGNQAAIGGTDTGEPFMLGTNVEGTALLCIELTGATSATVSIIGEEITMIPPKYLPDGIGYDNSEVILPLTDLRYVDESIDKYFVVDGFSNSLVADESYTVTYNGAVYTCIAKVPEGTTAVVLGNTGILQGLLGPETSDTNVPFLILSGSDASKLYLYTDDVYGDDGITTATLSITRDGLHKIPEKYLPDIDTKIDAKIDNIGIPAITVADAGKFLRVSSDGKWVLESLQNAEEVTF